MIKSELDTILAIDRAAREVGYTEAEADIIAFLLDLGNQPHLVEAIRRREHKGMATEAVR